LGEALLEGTVARELVELGEFIEIIEHALADRIADEASKAVIGLEQPAPRRDAVGLVGDAARKGLVQVFEDGRLHELGMESRHAIDLMGPRESELSHAHAP